jgi:hypothetical protein
MAEKAHITAIMLSYAKEIFSCPHKFCSSTGAGGKAENLSPQERAVSFLLLNFEG